MTEFHVERVYFDRDLAEAEGGRPGLRYTFDGGDSYMGHRDFLAFLREIGVRPKNIDWQDAGAMNIAGGRYANFSDEREDEEEEDDE
jgi:hypothetical protein